MGNTRLKCSFCTNTFEIDHRMDEHLDEVTRCPHCGIGIATILFEFVGYTPDENEESDSNAQRTSK